MDDDQNSVSEAETSIEGTPNLADNNSSDAGTGYTGSQPEEGSSTTQDQPTTTDQPQGTPAPAANPWESDENPYRKRFNDVLGNGQRLYQEVQEFRKKYDGIDPDLARKALEQHKHQESMAKLKPWNKGHEGYDKFQTVKNRASEYRRMQQHADTPEKQALLKDMAASMFAPEELGLVQEYEQDRTALVSQFAEDPRGFISELVQPAIQEAISQYEQFQKSSSQTASWFNDPGNQPLLDKYAPDMYRIMDPNVPARDKAIEVARLKAENESLKARLMSSSETEAMAAAQVGNRSRAAATTTVRNTPSRGVTDPYQHVIKQGFKPGTVEFAVALQKLNNQG